MPTATSQRITTAKELYELPADGYRYELVSGNLHMTSPAGGRHGRLANRISMLLNQHVDANHLGVVFAAETGFLIQTDPDTVFAPDVAFVSLARFKSVANEVQYLPLAPELAIEVLSPSDRFSRVVSKAFAWLDAGTKLVLVIDPDSETIHAYRSRKQIEVFERSEPIDCTNAVSNWTLVVDDVFRLYS